MKKKILVPIDFSADSINALEHAIEAANKIDADINMIFVKKDKKFEAPFFFEALEDSMGDRIEDYFEILIKKYRDKVKGNIDYKVRVGKIYKEICNQAKYDDTYFIMMGTHGASGFEEFFIGSNAYKVVQKSPCPVITIRHSFKKNKIKKIVMPIDMSKESRQKVPFVTDLAKILDAEIHIISVRESDNQSIIDKLEVYKNQVQHHIEKRQVKFKREAISGNNNTKEAIEYALKINADLIAIVTEQTENPINIILGPYSQQMVNHSPIPVLNIHSELLSELYVRLIQ